MGLWFCGMVKWYKDYDIERIYNNVSKLKIFFDDNVITQKFELLDKEE